MKKRQIVILLIFILAITGIVLKLMSGMEPPKEDVIESSEDIKFVKTQYLTKDTIPIQIMSSGRIKSVSSIALSSQSSGMIIPGDVPLKEGQRINKGQVVFRIDQSQEAYNLKAMKSAFLTLVANGLVDIKTDFPDRYIEWESFFSNIQYDKRLPVIPEAKSTREKTFIATRNIYSEYFKIKSEEARLAKYNIKAPFSGSIMAVMQNVGANVSPGMAVVQIAENANLELILPIPVTRKSEVVKGQKVDIQVKGQIFEGVVKRMASNLDVNSQSVNVYISFNNKGSIYEGMYVDAKINVGLRSDVNKVSDRALLNGNEAYFVNKDTALVKREVNVLSRDKSQVILSGFEEGDQIVVEPIPGAFEGMKVNPIQPE